MEFKANIQFIKYANRKLYDLSSSQYTSIRDVKALVEQGADVTVRDYKTGVDVTAEVLKSAISQTNLTVAQLTSIIREASAVAGHTVLEVIVVLGFITFLGMGASVVFTIMHFIAKHW